MSGVNLKDLYASVADGTLGDYLDAHPELIDTAVAETARGDVLAATEAGRTDVVYVAATSAAFIYLRLGQRVEALTNQLDAMQALFMVAEDAEAYQRTRLAALTVGGQALEISAAAIAFRAQVLAADCAWFAAELVDRFGPEREEAEGRLLLALSDVADAAELSGPLADDPGQAGWIVRLASLLSAVAEAGMEQPWATERALPARTALRGLARAAEQLPLELSFDGAGGTEKSAQVASILAELDARHGEASD